MGSALIASCKSDPEVPRVLTKLTVATAASSVPIAATVQATATGVDQFGNPIETGPVAWTSTAAVSISQSGVVTGVSIGQADVIAVAGQVVGTTKIAVTAKPASKIQLTTIPIGAERSGINLVSVPAIQLVDADGVAVRQDGVTISAALTSGGGTLNGPATAVTSAIGTAIFANLAVTGASGGKSITFSAPGLASTVFNFTLVSGVPASIAIVSGNNQTQITKHGTVPLLVKVLDVDGYPVPNVQISWSIGSGGGSIPNSTTTTDINGQSANGSWTLGTFGPNSLIARAAGVTQPVTFTANALHEVTTAQLTLSSPTVAVGQSVQATVQTFDENGALFTPTIAPQWFASNGLAQPLQTGQIIGTSAGDGFVYVRAGQVTLQTPLTVTGVATRKLAISQAPITIVSGAQFNPQPVVQLLDVATGLPVREAGHPVTLTTFGSTSAVGNATALTDANGEARFTNLGLVVDRNIVGGGDFWFSTDNGIPVQRINVTILPAAPAQFKILFGDNQYGIAGKPVDERLQLTVCDSIGNPVGAGVPVTFTVTAGGGTVSQATAVTQSGGFVDGGQWTLGAVGLNTVTATSTAFPGSFTFRALARPY